MQGFLSSERFISKKDDEDSSERIIRMVEQWDINRIVDEYADTIARICCSYGKNYHDTQDILQTVFMKLIKADPVFETKEHEKAWIIRVTLNSCKDFARKIFRWHQSLDEVQEIPVEEGVDLSYVREAVIKLPAKYRDVIYLFYYEGYTAVEIAGILDKNENTVYSLLSRGRAQLKDKIGGDFK